MKAAQILHAIVSFVCMEDTSERKPQTGTVSAREMLIKAATVRECLGAYAIAKEGELPAERVLDRLKKIARSFDDWLDAMTYVGQESELGKSISELLMTMSLSFEQWQQVYRALSAETVRTQVMGKMLPLAGTLSDLEHLYDLARDRTLREDILKRMAPLARTLEEKVRVYDLSAEDSPIREAISRELMLMAKSFGDWERILDQSDSESALERFAAARLVESAPGKLSDLANLLSYEAISRNDQLRNSVLLRLKQAQASFEEWKDVLEGSEDGSDFEHVAASMLVGKASEDPKILVDVLDFDCIYDDSELREVVLEKLRHTHASFGIWKDIHSERDEVGEVAVEKMIETATTVDELLEVAEMTDGDRDDETDAKFVEKFKSSFGANETDCRKVLDDYDEEHVLFSVALKCLLDMAQTAEQCLKIYFETDYDDDNTDAILDRIFSVATPGECAIIALVAEDGTKLRDRAEEQVSKTK